MPPKKIMLIDDDREFLDELKEILVLSGYDITAFASSEFAIRMLPEIEPDLILLDLKMDEKSGFAIADELTHYPETAHIPIVAMTGHYTDSAYQKLMKRCGIRETLAKPFHPVEVIHLIERCTTPSEEHTPAPWVRSLRIS